MGWYSPYNYAFNNPIGFVDPDGMGPIWPSWKDIKNGATNLLNKLPKINVNAKLTFGPQVGVSLGKIGAVDLTVFSLNIAEAKVSTDKGKVTKSESTVLGKDTKTGKSDGIQFENKAGISFLGTSAEGGLDSQLHVNGDIYTTGSKSVVKYGGLLSDSDFKPNSSSSAAIQSGTSASISSTQVTETRFGQKTKSTENSFTIGLKALIGAELKFTY